MEQQEWVLFLLTFMHTADRVVGGETVPGETRYGENLRRRIARKLQSTW